MKHKPLEGAAPISELLHEMLKGKGRLVSQGEPSADYQVEYRFHILRKTEEKPGFAARAPQQTSRGQVVALDGRFIPSGTYQLQEEGGEIIQVRNWGTVWTILVS